MLKHKLEWIDVALMFLYGCIIGAIAVTIFAVAYEPRWTRLEEEMITLRKIMTELNNKFDAFQETLEMDSSR